jgi:general secretion pathway protein E
LASTLRAVLAQRLVRRLCPQCKTPFSPDAALKARLGLPDGFAGQLYNSGGCDACGKTGYSGRLGVYELLVINSNIKRLIHEQASEDQIERVAFEQADMLFGNGMRHVVSGETSPDELLHVCRRETWSNGSV